MPQAQQLPLPPQPVMPDTGPVPLQRQPTPGENAELSPTAMIQNYLSQRGYQPTPENVSRALQANARDPGVISGLRSDTAGVNPTGGGGGPNLPTPPIPPVLEHTNQPTPEQLGPPAPPAAADTSGGMGLLGTLGALIAAAGGGYGLQQLLGPKAVTPPAAPTPTQPA